MGVSKNPSGAGNGVPADLLRQDPNLLGDLRLQRFHAEVRKNSNEFGKWPARGYRALGVGSAFARQRDIPRAVEGEVSREDCDAQQRPLVSPREAHDPDLGVEGSTCCPRARRMDAWLKHRIQLAPCAGNGDPSANPRIDECVHPPAAVILAGAAGPRAAPRCPCAHGKQRSGVARAAPRGRSV